MAVARPTEGIADGKPEQPKSAGKASAANITDQERDWAQQALAEYERKNYKSCLEHLERIAETRLNDPKVQLNRAIVEFFNSGLCTTDRFQKSLAEACKQVRFQRACANRCSN